MRLVNPLEEFGPELASVTAPARYLGFEYGATVKPHGAESLYNVAMAFPDLYEIGMSNLAVKIIYNGLNSLPSVRCERVFAPDVDFEALLRRHGVPLFTLETGMPLCSVDMVGFSIGYELGITEVLAMLDSGGIPLRASDRKEGDPLVLAGGCGVTNPAPFGSFFDALIIGEAEAGMFPMVEQLSRMKEQGASRAQMVSYIETLPFIWTERTANAGKVARRAVQGDFGLVPSVPTWFPMATQKPVQDHGVVEIMRGCPNGCRFCHAGTYYRPNRVKALPLIIEETDHLVFDAGYREISLNSLSSADFPGIENLLDILNERYKGYNVSFQLPSLKVNSLSLPILEKLSAVRKSGLTFAVETPEEMWQLSLNKEVYAQHLTDIIMEAKKRGWSSAKFYFMIGLPVGDYFCAQGTKSEEESIADFLIDLQERTRIQCRVNVGIFVPKPHTAYQWVRQITPEAAQKKMDYLFHRLPRGKFKVGRISPAATILEGLLSRGDSRVSDVILGAYRKGARFDAWEEHLRDNMPLWEEAFAQNGLDAQKEVFREWSLDERLPWDSVSLGPPKAFFRREWERSVAHQLSPRCMADCTHRCGVCTQKSSERENGGGQAVSVHADATLETLSKCLKNKTVLPPPERPECNIPVLYRVIFSFCRAEGAQFVPYLAQVELFHKAFLRSSLPVVFTSGFNPLPRVEFATAMTVGAVSYDEVASCLLYDGMDEEAFLSRMNAVLPTQFRLSSAFIFPCSNGRKREALSQSLWGGHFIWRFYETPLPLSKKADSPSSGPGAEAHPAPCTKADAHAAAMLSEKADSAVPPAKDARKVLADERVREFMAQNGLSLSGPGSAGTAPGGVYAVVSGNLPVGADKKFRGLIEEAGGERWYAFCSMEKTVTLSRPELSGWTAQDEERWRHDNRNFVKSRDVPGGGGHPVPYRELYERIAKINADIIAQKEILAEERKVFYREHPDVFERHRKRNEGTE